MAANRSAGSSQSSLPSRAEELLIEFLAGTHDAPEQAFAVLCAAHPSQAEALGQLYSQYKLVQADLTIFGASRRSTQQPPDPDGARVGDTLGDFRLDARIARGGQGEVWEAWQVSLSRKVALKLVLPDRINAKTLSLFAREARAGGRLAHPGIVAVHGYGEDDGQHWIAQELVEGAWTLRNFIDEMRKEQELPKNYHRAVAVFVAELADALQAAHDAGVIHRDVKPQNVLVTPEDHPKLTDFGLARITDETALSMTGDFAGTWLYMSPEQVTAKRIELDHRTDIFSLGVVMYEMLALVRPFDGDTTHQIAENIVMREPPDLRKIRSRVPRDLAVICAKALEKAKDNRFPTMAEFAADLRRHLANEPIHAQPPTLLDRGVKWVRRNPTKSLATVVATMAFVVISGLALRISKQKKSLETKTAEARASALLADNNAARADKNAALATTKAEEATANAERADRKAEEAERKTRDVLRLSLSQDYQDLILEAGNLWPVHPQKIDALRDWIQRASALSGELPALERKRDELRATAIPQTDEQRQADRASHPEQGKLDPLRAEIESMRLALGVRRGESEVELPVVDWSQQPSGATALRDKAWDLVKPERDTFGQETLGFALVERALDGAQEAELAGALNVLAWAHFALGEDEAALDVSQAALESALEEETEKAGGRHEKLAAAVTAASSVEGLAAAEATIAGLESKFAELESRVNERQTWTFPAQEEARTRARWWHNQITGLIGDLRSLSSEGTGLLVAAGVSEQHGWSVARRLKSAERERDGFAPGGEYRVRWEAAAPQIAGAYPGLDLPVQMGLVPIGPDPVSKLWEFWHLESGTEPLRGADGVLKLEESSGLVLVLLPGGKYWMGAQSTDPDGHNFDEGAREDELPVHKVELSAFFLSKYEMTQGQWKRLAGENPSAYGPSTRILDYQHDLTHPVEQVSWNASVMLLDRVGLSLPSEAQWEYGSRAGTETAWWTGSERESLRSRGAANFADQAAARAGGTWATIKDWPELDDGFAVHAPVDEYAANGFGLHNVHGNVWEWCLDVYDRGFYGSSVGVDPVSLLGASALRVRRGGSFGSAASYARSALRNRASPRSEDSSLGLRPAQGITSFSFTTSPSSND